MRRFLIVPLLILLLSVNGYSQKETPQDTTEQSPSDEYTPVNIVKSNPLAMLWGQIPLTGELRIMYERGFLNDHAVYAAYGYNHPSPLINIEQQVPDSIGGGVSLSGFRIQIGYKYYLTNDPAPKGFYISPHVSYNTAKIALNDRPNSYFKMTYMNANVYAGYQVLASSHISFDIFAGIGVKSNSYELRYAPLFSIIPPFIGQFVPTKLNVVNVKPSFGFNFGIAF